MPNYLKAPLTEEDHVQGPPDAPATLLEYGDFQCPYCGAAYPIVKKVQEYFGDDLRFAFRHFPLVNVHPFAEPAAETAEWAGSHGRFWEMHDLLFENQQRLSPQLFFVLADQLDLDPDELATALEEGRFQNRVRRDLYSGLESGVHGTPTFFINGEMHMGSFAFDDLVAAIQEKVAARLRRAG